MTDYFSGLVNALLEVERTDDIELISKVLDSMDEMWLKIDSILTNQPIPKKKSKNSTKKKKK